MDQVPDSPDPIEDGDPGAAAKWLPLVRDEPRKLAAGHLASEGRDHTLGATAPVHEAYLRPIGDRHFDGREHFFAAAAEAMRRILVNQARDRDRRKRGGGRVRVERLDNAGSLAEDPGLVRSLDDPLDCPGREDASAALVARPPPVRGPLR